MTYPPYKYSLSYYNVTPLRKNLYSILPEPSQKYSLFPLLNTRNQRQFDFPIFTSSSCKGFSQELFTFSILTFYQLSALSFWTSIIRLFPPRFHLRELYYFPSVRFNIKQHSHTTSSLFLFCSQTAFTLKTFCLKFAKQKQTHMKI